MKNDYDVIIVGAGMVGLTCALALAKFGFRLCLVESRKIVEQSLPSLQSPYDSRVVAITRASEHLFTHLGVFDTILQTRFCAYSTMKVWDMDFDGRVEFFADDFYEPNLGYIVEQNVICGALWEALRSFDLTLKTGINNFSLETTVQNVTLHLSENSGSLSADLVIGADGANSLVRKLCQITSSASDYYQSAIVATLKSSKKHDYTAYQRFSKNGSLALLPLSDENTCSIVWATTPAKAAMLCEMPVPNFNEEITRESQEVMGQMQCLSDRFLFPLKMHHADAYGIARCALLGDAAHTLHPLAGQGVNLGLMDVAALVEMIALAKQKGRDIGSLSLLQKYERQRRLHNQIMIWAMGAFQKGFLSQTPLIQQLRNWGLNWVDKQKIAKALFVKLALGTMGPYPPLARKGFHHDKEYATLR